MVIPIRGKGEPHAQIGELGFLVSATLELTTLIDPIEIGNKQLQQTSAMGSTNEPWHKFSASAEMELNNKNIKNNSLAEYTFD